MTTDDKSTNPDDSPAEEQFVEFLPIDPDNDFSSLAELMRKAGRSKEEIAHAIEEARKAYRDQNIEQGDSGNESTGAVQASNTNAPNGQAFRDINPNCPYGRSASAFGISAQDQVYMWFQYVGGGTYNSKAFMCPYTEVVHGHMAEVCLGLTLANKLMGIG